MGAVVRGRASLQVEHSMAPPFAGTRTEATTRPAGQECRHRGGEAGTRERVFPASSTSSGRLRQSLIAYDLGLGRLACPGA
jgi:hypothetical protein